MSPTVVKWQASLIVVAIVMGCNRDRHTADSTTPTRIASSVRDSTSALVVRESVLPTLPLAGLDKGGFGLVNENGNAIVGLDRALDSGHVSTAICRKATRYPLSDAGQQAGDEQHSTPVTAENFANIPGHLFHVTGHAPSDGTCFLTSDSSLILAAAPTEKPIASDCPTDWVHQVSATKRAARRLVSCRPDPRFRRAASSRFAWWSQPASRSTGLPSRHYAPGVLS